MPFWASTSHRPEWYARFFMIGTICTHRISRDLAIRAGDVPSTGWLAQLAPLMQAAARLPASHNQLTWGDCLPTSAVNCPLSSVRRST